MPVRLTVLVPPDVELLEIVMVPEATPVVVGLKLTCSDRDWPGFSVAGSVAPDIANAVPETVTEPIVTAVLPDEVSVSVLVEVVFSVMMPKSRVVALALS